MLRNRSRSVSSKQAIMSDHTPICNRNQTSLFNSPRFFPALSPRSPTSILDNKQFSNFTINPFGYNTANLKPPVFSSGNSQKSNKMGSEEAIGLAIIDSNSSKPKKMVLFAAKLKVQIPSLEISQSSQSPTDFGTKTRSTHTGVANQPKNSPKLSWSEMEMSEDYTCVISHGPNPKTIHIFDDCVMDSCLGLGGAKEHSISSKDHDLSAGPLNFLSFCHACKVNLQQGNDIYMYRGDKAFCSVACRCQEMLSEEEENSWSDQQHPSF